MNREKDGTREALRKLGSLGSAGMAAGLVLAAFVIGGHYLDEVFGSSPVLTICGIVLGVAGCFVTLIRSVTRGG